MGKIHCAICNRKCKGDVLKLEEKFIHKECFNCYRCSHNLENGGFFHKEGHYYCTEDYQKLFGVICDTCHQYIDGEVVTILDRSFHTHCFRCHNCSHPIHSGDKATLWDGHYLCDWCSSKERHEKENVSPSSFDLKSPSDSDFIVPTSGKPTESAAVVSSISAALFTDSNDADGPAKPREYLHLHVENGYTSTDSGVEKTKSEIGYLSPCYSTSSGDESWMRSHKSKRSKTQNYFQFGKCLNQSYLTIEKRMSERTPANARYRAMINPTTADPKYSHFHRPDNFSYRSQPNIHSKKASPLSPNYTDRRCVRTPQSASMRLNGNTQDSQADLNLTAEVKRLAHFPDGREPDYSVDPPIDRYDFPAPPFTNMVMRDKKIERASRGRAVVSTGDIFSDTFSGTDTAMDSTDFAESEDERVRRKKVERKIQLLKASGKCTGLSQSILDEFEKRTDSRMEMAIDPVSSSRSPDASFEPSYKTRYDRHTFTSPSRDSRYEGRRTHELQSKMQYTNTGGRTGTMSGYESAAQTGYGQGYLSCGEGALLGRPTSSLSYKASSLPRPMHMYAAQMSVPQTRYLIDSHMTPSMTTSGYSVDAITHSIDESTLIEGSEMVTSHGHRNGYTSDMAPSSAISDSRRTRPEWYYESDNDAVLHSNYPTVQSYLKPSNLLRAKEKIPAQIIPYEIMKISNFSLPKGLDRTKLEIHLSDSDFHMVFQMTRQAFNRLPEWKRNDLKQKMDLY